MSPSTKPLILIVIILLFVPLLLLLGLNLFLQTPAIKERLRSALEKSIGLPVSIAGISATPLGGIKARGMIAGNNGSNSELSIDSLIITPNLLKLLQRQIVIEKVCINHAVVKSSLVRTDTSSTPSSQPAPEGSQPTSVTQSPPYQEKTTPSFPFTLLLPSIKSEQLLQHLRHLTITDSDLMLLNAQNLPLVWIQGLKLSGKNTSGSGWKGSFEAQQITVGKGLILHDLQSPLALSPDLSTIIIENLAATLGGGKLAGKFTLALPPLPPEYKTKLTLTEGSLKQFFIDASLGNSASEGAVSGDLDLTGIAGNTRSMEGMGSILCTGAVIQPADFLRQIGEVLQIQELQMLHLAEGKAFFKIHQGEGQIDQLSLRSENLILSAQGPIRSNGDLDLQARLLFNEKLSNRLHGFLGPQLTQAPEPGYSQVTFHVSGSPKNPRTDLLERLTGIHIGGDLGGLLQGLFGRPH